jgi:hypothetical protein
MNVSTSFTIPFTERVYSVLTAYFYNLAVCIFNISGNDRDPVGFY